MRNLLEIFLPVYFLVYFGVAFALPSYRVYRQIGVNPVTFGNSDNAHDYIGKLFKVVIACLVLVVIIYSFLPRFYFYLLPVICLEIDSVKIAGLSLLILSLGWTVAAQIQMGNSWRIGIDEEKKTSLVQGGIFRFSRNPIFLGMIVTLTGIFLVIPNALTLLFLGLGFVLIQIQVRLEEEFLTRLHEDKYVEYRHMVQRWL